MNLVKIFKSYYLQHYVMGILSDFLIVPIKRVILRIL